MEKVLVDSCIFIDIFRGNADLYRDLLKRIVFLNSIVYMELIQGSRHKIELEKIDKFLKDFKLLPLTQMEDGDRQNSIIHYSAWPVFFISY